MLFALARSSAAISYAIVVQVLVGLRLRDSASAEVFVGNGGRKFWSGGSFSRERRSMAEHGLSNPSRVGGNKWLSQGSVLLQSCLDPQVCFCVIQIGIQNANPLRRGADFGGAPHEILAEGDGKWGRGRGIRAERGEIRQISDRFDKFCPILSAQPHFRAATARISHLHNHK